MIIYNIFIDWEIICTKNIPYKKIYTQKDIYKKEYIFDEKISIKKRHIKEKYGYK